MKKTILGVIFCSIIVVQTAVSQSWERAIYIAEPGLNYTQASVLLGQRYFDYGLPYTGVVQPTDLIISGVPSGAIVEKAYVWWSHYGSDSTSSVTFQNPQGSSQTFEGLLVGANEDHCWGPERAFRVDVTSLVSGNGTYQVSGLDTAFIAGNANTDVDGATLFVIYSEPSSSVAAKIVIFDGMVKIEGDTMGVVINNLGEIPIQNPQVTAFALMSDLEAEYPSFININQTGFSSYSETYWDFIEKNTSITKTQTEVAFDVASQWDCSHFIMGGIIMNFPTDSMPLGRNDIQKESRTEFKIYPNPANKNITVFSTETSRKLIIYDITGKMVYTSIFETNNLTIEVEQWKSGIYFVSNGVETKKLVITGNN